MIAAGLVGLISIGILSVIVSFAKNNSRAAAREDIQDLNKVLQLLLMNDNLCDRAITALGNAPIDFVPPTTPVNAILDPGNPGTPIVRSGDIYSRLQIGQITLERDPNDQDPPRQETLELNAPNALAAGPVPAPVAQDYTIYRVNLVVPVTSRNASPTGPRDSYAPIMIPLRIYTLAGNTRVARCQISNATNQTCSSLGATYDPVQGRCVFPVCNQAIINSQVARGIPNYSCQNGANCSEPIFYWGFYNENRPVNPNTNLPNTIPVCICTNSCAPQPY